MHHHNYHACINRRKRNNLKKFKTFIKTFLLKKLFNLFNIYFTTIIIIYLNLFLDRFVFYPMTYF